MRQNGLRASSFVAIADVDPRIADQLLDLLAFAHVAAYAEPVPGLTGVYRDHHVPARPLDRLWVDRAATAAARQVLDRSLAHLLAELETAIAEGTLATGAAGSAPLVTPGSVGPGNPGWPGGRGGHQRRGGDDMDESVVSQRWQEIIADWDGPSAAEPTIRTHLNGPSGRLDEADGARRVGEVRGLDRIHSDRPDDRERSRAIRRVPPDSSGTGTGGVRGYAVGPRDRVAPAEDDHYEPPPPTRHPPLEAVARLGWVGVVGGPVLLVLVVAFGPYLPSWVPLLGVVLLVAGFAVLVSRLHRGATEAHHEDDDDGAVV